MHLINVYHVGRTCLDAPNAGTSLVAVGNAGVAATGMPLYTNALFAV
jgi:hypothetical protein